MGYAIEGAEEEQDGTFRAGLANYNDGLAQGRSRRQRTNSFNNDEEEGEARVCPTCDECLAFQGRSASFFQSHVSVCVATAHQQALSNRRIEEFGAGGALDASEEEEVEEALGPMMRELDVVDAPGDVLLAPWMDDLFYMTARSGTQEVSYKGMEALAMLVGACRVEGHQISISAWNTILKVMGLPLFQRLFQEEGLPRSMMPLLKAEERFAGNRWTQIKVPNSNCKSGFSIWNCRDLVDLFLEMISDPGVRHALLEGENCIDDPLINTDDNGIKWAANGTFFRQFQADRNRIRAKFPGDNVLVIGICEWDDGGQVDGKRAESIEVVTYCFINVPNVVARGLNGGAIGAWAYTGSDINDYFRAILPQMLSLLEAPRWVAELQRNIMVVFSTFKGDHPSQKDKSGRLKNANANEPCSECGEFHCGLGEHLNEPARWLCVPFSQREATERLARMKSDPRYTQQESGISQMYAVAGAKPPALWVYYDCIGCGDDPEMDLFARLDNDMMHNAYLGVWKEFGKAIVEVVEAKGKKMQFRSEIAILNRQKTRFLDDITLVHHKALAIKDTTCDLFGLLKKGALMAREYQSLCHLLPIVLHAIGLDAKLITSLCDLISFTAFLESRRYPINQEPEWWDNCRTWAISAYKVFQSATLKHLAPEKDFIKIHSLFCHALTSRARRGAGSATQGTLNEGIFRIVQQTPTSRKNEGYQLMVRLAANTISHRWINGSSLGAQAVLGAFKVAKEWPCGDVENISTRSLALQEMVGVGTVKVKWIRRVGEEELGVDRGTFKFYACAEWCRSSQYDFIRCANGVYVELQILEVSPSRKHPLEFYGIGYQLTQHKAREDVLHYRLPTFTRKRGANKEAVLIRVRLDLEHDYPVPMQPRQADLRPEDLNWIRICEPNFRHEIDKIYHHLIFMTRGRGRNPIETDWYAGNSVV